MGNWGGFSLYVFAEFQQAGVVPIDGFVSPS